MSSTTSLNPTSPKAASDMAAGVARVTGAAVAVVLVTIALAAWVARQLWLVAPDEGVWHTTLHGFAIFGVVLTLGLLIPLANAIRQRGRVARAVAADDALGRRKYTSRARTAGWVAIGCSVAAMFGILFVQFLLANNHAVQSTFFDPTMIQRSFVNVAQAFSTNIYIAFTAEIIVLTLGLLLALLRLAPGKAGRPISLIAIAYVDIFRAVPGIIVIYLVGFGLPLAQIPLLSSMSATQFAILALSLTYSAYVAEVFRAGIQSVHSSQVAAARSLGFSHIATMRYVVVPQAVRRVIPPLLNDFIGLQKDTALVMVIGTIDAFNQATIYASNYFNLSAVTVVAALFILITIPQTRFVDRLIARDQMRTQGTG